ncbi:MAG: DUF6843 domain-containing protein [Pyrinomonadaceae bacterium]
MKALAVMIVTVAVAVAITVLISGRLKFEKYYIPANVERGWMVVDFGNPKCDSLQESGLSRVYRFPKTGYLCTSTHPTKGWVRKSFYLVGSAGELNEIKENKDFFGFKRLFGTFGPCSIIADAFWYSPGEKLNSDEFEFLEKHRPECH